MQFIMFSKHLAPLSIEEAACRAGEVGFQGLDLTVRQGGHIQPEEVRAHLAPAVAAVRKLGLDIPMITTNITSADEAFAAETFAAAAECGIRQLKLGYWHYRGFGQVRAQLDEVRASLDGIAKLAEGSGVTANIHIHSEAFMSADAAVVYLMLKDRDPKQVGVYIDPGHMTVEGGGRGWMIGLDLLSPWVNLVAVKSMAWVHEYDPELMQERWRPQMVPLRQGAARWLEVFRCLKQIGYDGIISLHSEYQGSYSWRDLSTDEVLAQSAEDLAFIKYIAARVSSEG
ncbi:MAG: sugar phosphate isomerase/epimerase family protein [Anaerolineae bacterium]